MDSAADDRPLTLRLQMPDCLTAQYGKYLTIEGVRFAYGHEQVLATLDSNAKYARYRLTTGTGGGRPGRWRVSAFVSSRNWRS